ncbi:MAG: DNA mismatch repair protein MutS, partial [Deltaproteobacteria bacterium]|nr:DNA mismatch repair protein MutS [Deltaproteobacteria bacterium]
MHGEIDVGERRGAAPRHAAEQVGEEHPLVERQPFTQPLQPGLQILGKPPLRHRPSHLTSQSKIASAGGKGQEEPRRRGGFCVELRRASLVRLASGHGPWYQEAMANLEPPGRLTPAMQQFWDAKQTYPDCVLLFRMGDFYETFYDDAVTISRELDLTLTSRDKGAPGGGIPMAGVPHHAVGAYVARLVEKGYKVAICDQMEDPALAKGLVRREVTRVVTPGVVLDTENLSAAQANFLLALAAAGEAGPFGLAYLDISTGEFWASEAAGRNVLLDELTRIEPRELRLAPEAAQALQSLLEQRRGWLVEAVAAPDVPGGRALERLLAGTGRDSTATEGGGITDGPPAGQTPGQAAGSALGWGLTHRQAIDSFGFAAPELVARAAALVLGYIERTQKRVAAHVRPVRCYSLSGTMIIDETTMTNLELTRTLMGGKRHGSLLGLLDRTRTAMGARLLRRWLCYPLLSPAAIAGRLDAVEDLVTAATLRAELGELFAGLGDLERLAGRLGAELATPRELKALQQGAEALPRLQQLLAGEARAAVLRERSLALDCLGDLAEMIATALVDDPPSHTRDGGVFRPGYDPQLDELLALSSHGKDFLLELEVRERKATGIASLKVRYNKVFGYYLEVSRANFHLVPERYIRKQTMANAERFYTPELKEWEEKVVSAEGRRVALEAELFERLRNRLALEVRRIQQTAGLVAELDVYTTLAELAVRQGYVRPEVDDADRIVIEDGRHPVVEAVQSSPFVPNSLELDCSEQQLLIITGPNMAGKSTAMRQTALVVLL